MKTNYRLAWMFLASVAKYLIEGVFEVQRIKTRFFSLTALIIAAAMAVGMPMEAFAAFEFHVSDGASLSKVLQKELVPNTMTTIYLDSDIDAIASATLTTAGLVTIEGNGHTINGNGLVNTALRFSNTGAPTAFSHNEMVLRNVTFKDLNSSIQYGGGAIAMRSGKLTVENCAFIGNSWISTATNAQRGGGAICMENAASVLEITNSTFYGNETEVSGVIGLAGSGGAIYTAGGGSIKNSTIVGNEAVNSNAGASVTFGGGIYKLSGGSSVLELSNNIVAENTSQNGSASPVADDIYDGNTATAGLLFDGDYNLIKTAVATGGVAFTPVTNTKDGTVLDWSFLDTEPRDNGGSTLTIALLTDSNDAVDKIPSGAPVVDQRGFERDGLADIGAYEYGAVDSDPLTPPSSGSGGCNTGAFNIGGIVAAVMALAATRFKRKRG
ncbi:MAG: hypothetical protein LBT23_06105 [Synergistaceae bacterium]|nr:hypothetical protein [Synergistaceae bacterium]